MLEIYLLPKNQGREEKKVDSAKMKTLVYKQNEISTVKAS